MQPQPLLRITGHVVGVRTVEVPERTDDEGKKVGDAFSYVEASIIVPAAYENVAAEGMTAVIGVTCQADDPLAKATQGEAVDVLARAYSTWRRYRGRSFPVVAFRFCGIAAARAVRAAS